MNIPGYRIQREVGRGGVATVYVAIQESLQRKVALKVMSPGLTTDPSFTERFIREGLTIAQLNHQGIVTIYDISVSDYNHYIAMEYLPGGSLKDRLKKPLSPRSALRLIKQVAIALGYAHAKGIIHRDVKPENIMFRSNREVVLTDFGIAKSNGSNNELTSAGVIVGTPRYISPEQASGRGTDQRSDIYALGVILFELLTGKPPYDAKESMAILYSHINDPIPELDPRHKYLQPLVDAMLAKDPNSRIAECKDLVTYIERLQEAAFADDADAVTEINTALTGKTVATTSSNDGGRPLVSVYLAKILWGAIGVTAAAIIIAVGWSMFRSADIPPLPTPVSISGPPVARPPMIVSPRRVDAPRTNRGGINRDMEPDVAAAPAGAAPDEGAGAGEDIPPALPEDLEKVADGVIRNLLKTADTQMATDRLNAPQGDNALHSYREILVIDPDNTSAREGINRIAKTFLDRARQEFENDAYSKALALVDEGLAAQPEHPGLIAYRQEVEKMAAADAAFQHGDKLFRGEDVAANVDEAVNWYRRAADSGHVKAQYALGVAYANGTGVRMSQPAALHLLRRAAAGGSWGAQYNLGLGLLFGPNPDTAAAADLFESLAAQKYEAAYPVLGWMYRTGTGVKFSVIKAVKWGAKGAFTYGPGNYPTPERVVTDWQRRLEKVFEAEAAAQESARQADNR